VRQRLYSFTRDNEFAHDLATVIKSAREMEALGLMCYADVNSRRKVQHPLGCIELIT
jgi:hypothetical protein